jgi:hypothetical protein
VKYIAAHPEFDASAKRNAAAKILARAIAGEDFAALANQYSEDPGNTGPDGKKERRTLCRRSARRDGPVNLKKRRSHSNRDRSQRVLSKVISVFT